MTLDVRTLVAVLAVGHVLQVLVLSLQFAVFRAYRGIGWWLLWSASVSVGFVFMLLREVPALHVIAIVAQNGFIVGGVAFLYVGLMRFHGASENRRLLGSLLVLYFAGHSFFTFVVDEIEVRSFIIAATLAAISLLTARDLFRLRAVATRASANFLCAVLLGHGLFFAVRVVLIAGGSSTRNTFSGSAFNVAPFLDGLVVSNLLTLGLVILVNQRAHGEMVEARDHFALLFETSPDAVLLTRAEDGVCRNVNEGFEALTGFRREEILGRSAADLNLYHDQADRERVLTALRQNGSVHDFEIAFRARNGRPFVGAMSARCLSLGGVPHIMSVTRDVTEQKAAAEALARSAAEIRELNSELEKRVAARTADLTEKNQELESFVYSIAHDLRAPLRAIDGFSGILEEEHSDRLDSEGIRLLSRVRAGAEKMDQLIRDLLEYARASTAQLHRGSVNMGALAREAFQDVVPTESHAGIDFVIGELPEASGDAALLRVVFQQLLANAVKFTAARPERRIEVRAVREEDADWYEIADSGIGFEPAHEQKLFGVFQRLHARDGFKGTGIGLAIVKRIVERHGGRVRAEGVPGRGAAFAFTIPEAGGVDA